MNLSDDIEKLLDGDVAPEQQWVDEAMQRYPYFTLPLLLHVKHTSDNEAQLADFKNRKAINLAEDKEGRDVFLAESPYALQMAMEKYPDIEFHFTSEF